MTRAAEAAEILGVDASLRGHWREVAAQLAPYPAWETAEGPEFAGIGGEEPKHLPDDHFGEAAFYPTLLADEVNLDSPQSQKDMMLRTIRALRPAGTSSATLLLLGVPDDQAGSRRQRAGENAETLLNSRSGRIHLFPLASQTAEVAFRNFQARGGFLVSACKNSKGVYHVEILARRDISCRLMNPWPGQPVVVRAVGQTESVPVQIDRSNGECLVFAAVANQKYRVEPE